MLYPTPCPPRARVGAGRADQRDPLSRGRLAPCAAVLEGEGDPGAPPSTPLPDFDSVSCRGGDTVLVLNLSGTWVENLTKKTGV